MRSCLRFLLVLLAVSGCANTRTSDTARTSKEQLLISNAIDQSLNKVDFSMISGAKTFIDDKYLECVDKQYLVGSIRHRVFRGGGRVVEKADEADVILEVRSGAVGTTSSEMFVGVPEIAVPGPLPISLPEVKFLTKQEQTGMAKIGIIAFDAKSREMLGEGGVTLAKSDDNNWYVFGVGPYQNGSIRSEVADGVNTTGTNSPQQLPRWVALGSPRTYPPGASSNVQFAGSTEDGNEAKAVTPATN